ncbi:hypothetical protein IAG41_04800 [Sphingomonas sp. JC676]|uniref:hypothetical protein n=1 Tax=Sphingomonas sp. JC676 TaxID=2768065 RepID=UPI001657C555|nr:hypothetical protein [Sphingomonas sp. JC676]MBC9031704.1 hypothetical protein [Sphingomonas sp. JC676]
MAWFKALPFRHCAHPIIAVAAFSLFIPASANACFVVAPVYSGTKAEVAARKKQKERERIVAVRVRQQKFREGVRAGTIDSANGLAVLLIPNIREWYADKTGCGPGGDGDGPSMPMEMMLLRAFSGSELDGLDGDTLSDFISGRFTRGPLDSYNHDCSAEFRSGFASRLRTAVPRADRDKAFLLLSDRGERGTGYYKFADVARVTQPYVSSSPPGPAKLLADRGHPVTLALESFWTDAVPQLGSPASACPKAYRQLVALRGAELQQLRKRPYYPRLVERATSERKRR